MPIEKNADASADCALNSVITACSKPTSVWMTPPYGVPNPPGVPFRVGHGSFQGN